MPGLTNDEGRKRWSQPDSKVDHKGTLPIPMGGSNSSTVGDLAKTTSNDEGSSWDTDASHRADPNEEFTPGRSPVDGIVRPRETVDELQEAADCSPENVENTSDIPSYTTMITLRSSRSNAASCRHTFQMPYQRNTDQSKTDEAKGVGNTLQRLEGDHLVRSEVNKSLLEAA